MSVARRGLPATESTEGSSNKRMKLSDEKAALKESLFEILKFIKRIDENKHFQKKPSESETLGYFPVVKTPIDLPTIKRKVDGNEYSNFAQFQKDFSMMCNNALSLNESKSDVYLAAKDVLKRGEEFIGDSLKKWIATYNYDINSNNDTFVESKAHLEQSFPQVSLDVKDSSAFVDVPFYSGKPAPSASLRLGSLLRISAPKFEAKEHSWNGATPVTDFQPGAYESFAPTHDSSVANVDYNTSSLLMDPPTISTNGKPIQQLTLAASCRAMLGCVARIKRPRQDARRCVEDLVLLSSANIDLMPLVKDSERPRASEADAAGKLATELSTGAGPRVPSISAGLGTKTILDAASVLCQSAARSQLARLHGDSISLPPLEKKTGSQLLKALTILCSRTVPARLVTPSDIRKCIGIKPIATPSRSESEQPLSTHSAAAPQPHLPQPVPHVAPTNLEDPKGVHEPETSDGLANREELVCSNCGLPDQPWTGLRAVYSVLCQACGGYYELHGRPRPVCYSVPASCTATNAVTANEDSQQDDTEDARGEFVDRDDGDAGGAQESDQEPGLEGGEAGQAGTARTQPNSDEDD